jgi:hypothetical protein
VGVQTRSTDAVLIAHDAEGLDALAQRVDRRLVDARSFIGPQQLADAGDLVLAYLHGFGEALLIRHRPLPLRRLLRDESAAAVGERVVLDEVDEDGSLLD